MENANAKLWFLLMRPLKSSSPKLHKISPWVCVIKACSNGQAIYIIVEIIAKDNLNIENLMQNFENLLVQNLSTEFLDIAH